MSGAGSSDPDGDALTYAWAFGDGGEASGATATRALIDGVQQLIQSILASETP